MAVDDHLLKCIRRHLEWDEYIHLLRVDEEQGKTDSSQSDTRSAQLGGIGLGAHHLCVGKLVTENRNPAARRNLPTGLVTGCVRRPVDQRGGAAARVDDGSGHCGLTGYRGSALI